MLESVGRLAKELITEMRRTLTGSVVLMGEVLSVVLVVTLVILIPFSVYAAYKLLPRRYGKAVFIIPMRSKWAKLARVDYLRINDQRPAKGDR